MKKSAVSSILDQLYEARSQRDLDRINGYRAAAKDFGKLTQDESTVLYNTITRIHAAIMLENET